MMALKSCVRSIVLTYTALVIAALGGIGCDEGPAVTPLTPVTAGETAPMSLDEVSDCRSPLNYCIAPQVCLPSAAGYVCQTPSRSPADVMPTPGMTAAQCPTSSAGRVYPVNPRVHVDTPSLDPLDSANIEPSILNVTAYVEYMSQLIRVSASPLRDVEGLAYFLAQRAEQTTLPFEVALEIAQRQLDPVLMNQYWSQIVPEVRGAELTDEPPRVMQRIVRGETQRRACVGLGYSSAECCVALAWFSALTRDEDLALIENGSFPSGYSTMTTALLDRERDDVERGASAVIQPFVHLGAKAWLSYCGGDFDGGPQSVIELKQSYGDYHTDQCLWSRELHPLSAAKKTGRRIYRRDLGQGQKITVAETLIGDCEVLETEVILLEGTEPIKFWSFDHVGQRVWHAIFLRKPGEDSIRYTPDSCMGCHYTFDQRRFVVVEPSYEALNLKYMIVRGEEQWEDSWACLTPEDYVVTHAAEVIQRPPPEAPPAMVETPPSIDCSSCGAGRVCDATQSRCISCADDAECLVGERCVEGGLCARPLTVGGPYEPYLYEILTRALECWDSYYGSEQIEACYALDVIAPLLDPSGSELTSTGRALDVEGVICDPNGEVARRFTGYEYAELRELFGCGNLDVWNIWWEEGFTTGEQLCIFYVPLKGGFSTQPVVRSEVIVFGACDRNWEDL